MAHPGGTRGPCPPGHPAHGSPGPNGTIYDVNFCAYIAAPGGTAVPFTGNPTPLASTQASSGFGYTIPGQVVARLPSIVDAGITLAGAADLLCRYFPNAPICEIPGIGGGFQTLPEQLPPFVGPIQQNGGPSCGPNGACPSGYHMNKNRYLTKFGIVEKGTKCVKNRRMNPTNPRALARAIRRGDSFVRLAKSFGMGVPKAGLKKRRRVC